jgi:hypothetical protein
MNPFRRIPFMICFQSLFLLAGEAALGAWDKSPKRLSFGEFFAMLRKISQIRMVYGNGS